MGIKIQAFDSAAGISRADLWMMPPIKPTKESGGLIIIGRDTAHTRGQHPSWRADCNDDPSPEFVASVRKHGVLQPIRARKISRDNVREAQVVMGRDRTKAARIIWGEGVPLKVPVMLFPMEATDADIMAAANAENYQRKTENIQHVAEHLYMHAVAEGHPAASGALQAVSATTGVSVQRIKAMFAFRCDAALVAAYEAGTLKGEAALALAGLPEEQRAQELLRIVNDPAAGRVAAVRERVAHLKGVDRNPGLPHPRHLEPGDLPEEEFDEYVAAVREREAPDASAPSPKAKKKKKTAKKNESNYPGLSKHLQKSIVDDQMTILPPADRDLDPLVMQVLRVCAGLIKPDNVKGMAKALKRLGL